ncbi:MAG: hypothetical protein ACXVPN_08020 [Bacteroidia bacterium]
MKNSVLSKVSLLGLGVTLLLSSCGGNKPEGGEDQMADTAKVDTTANVANNVSSNEMSYQIPSPKEMFYFIRQVGSKNNKRTDVLNSPDNAKSYGDAKAKAVNFGIYSCDLTYCSIFEIGTEALKYFKVVKQLGDEIGVSTSVKPEMLKRLEKNMGNPDSLVEIADDMYFSSFETLQNGQQGNTLAMVVAGGYIEGLYIATNLIKFDKSSPAVERIAGEKFTLENIIDFMKKYESDAGVKEVIGKLNELKVAFDADVTEKKAEPVAEKKDAKKEDKKGPVVLGGGDELVMNEAQYKNISEKVAAIRNSFIGK